MYKIQNEKLGKIKACLAAMESETVKQAAESTIIKTLNEWGVDSLEAVYSLTLKMGYNYSYLLLNIDVKDDNLYEKLMDSSHTGMSVEHIEASFSKKQVLVNYGIELDIRFNFQCNVPDEDLQTLRMIGKIKYDAGYMTEGGETISCSSY